MAVLQYQPGEGFHFDELSKIRVIDPQAAAQTEALKDECKEFVDSESDCIGWVFDTSTITLRPGIVYGRNSSNFF